MYTILNTVLVHVFLLLLYLNTSKDIKVHKNMVVHMHGAQLMVIQILKKGKKNIEMKCETEEK